MGLLQLSPTGLRSQMLWGLVFPVLETWAEEPDVGSELSCERTYAIQVLSSSCVTHRGQGRGVMLFEYITSLPPYLSRCGSFFMYLVIGDIF